MFVIGGINFSLNVTQKQTLFCTIHSQQLHLDVWADEWQPAMQKNTINTCTKFDNQKRKSTNY